MVVLLTINHFSWTTELTSCFTATNPIQPILDRKLRTFHTCIPRYLRLCVCVCARSDGIQPVPEAFGGCLSAAVQHEAQQRGSSLSGQHSQRQVSEQPAGAAGEDGKVRAKSLSLNLCSHIQTSITVWRVRGKLFFFPFFLLKRHPCLRHEMHSVPDYL